MTREALPRSIPPVAGQAVRSQTSHPGVSRPRPAHRRWNRGGNPSAIIPHWPVRHPSLFAYGSEMTR